MKEAWLQPGAIVPVDIPTTGELLTEIQRLRAALSSGGDTKAVQAAWDAWNANQIDAVECICLIATALQLHLPKSQCAPLPEGRDTIPMEAPVERPDGAWCKGSTPATALEGSFDSTGPDRKRGVDTTPTTAGASALSARRDTGISLGLLREWADDFCKGQEMQRIMIETIMERFIVFADERLTRSATGTPDVGMTMDRYHELLAYEAEALLKKEKS